MPLRSEIFDPSGQVDPNSELVRRAQREQAYGQLHEQALGTLKPPAMGPQYMQGPEGQMWRGVQQQQAFGAAQAGRRGYSPFAARGAAQAGAEIESQGYGAAQGIREQQEAFRQQAELGLLQRRSAQDFAQAGIESQQLGQRLDAQNWEAAQRAALQAERDAEERRMAEAGLGAFSNALNMITSDERAKINVTDGGPAADALMGALGQPIQMVGEYGNPANPRTAIVYTGDMKIKAQQKQAGNAENVANYVMSDEDYGAAQPALMAPMAMPIRGVAIESIGEGGPSIEQMPQGAVVPLQQLGMSVRGMTPERRARAEAALGIARPIDPRAAQYVAQQMPRAVAMASRAPSISDAEYGTAESMQPEDVRTAADITGRPVQLPSGVVQMPTQVLRAETPEQALRRRKAEQDAEQLAGFFNERAGIFEAQAAKPTKQKADELATAMDEYAKEYSRSLGARPIDAALDSSAPKSYDYRQGAGPAGRQLGVMAQDVAASPLTAAMVTPTSRGLALNPAKAVGPLLGMVGRLNERVSKVEGK